MRRHVFGLIVSACGLPFGKVSIAAAVELSHSPKWSKYLANWLQLLRWLLITTNSRSPVQLSEICAGELPNPSPSPSRSHTVPQLSPGSQTEPGRCLICSKLFVAPACYSKTNAQQPQLQAILTSSQTAYIDNMPLAGQGSSAKTGPFVSAPQKW